jgi:hypothetical protein
MSQSFVTHEIARHALPARQSTLQPLPLPQLIAPHAPEDGHVMLHLKPAGQVMLPLPVPRIVHVPIAKSQLWHTDGQIAASGSGWTNASAMRGPTTQ